MSDRHALTLAHQVAQSRAVKHFTAANSQLRAKVARAERAYYKTAHELEQLLGRALGYPWFKDDQVNFPGSTEADGVCVGEHVPESIAAEAAARIESMRAALRAALAVIEKPAKCHEVDTDPKYDNCTGTPRYSAGLRIHHRECFELRAVIIAALERT